MEIPSLVEEFLYNGNIRFVNRGVSSGAELELIILNNPITGASANRYRSKKVLSGRTIKEAFDELWQELVRVLELESCDALDKLYLIAKHSVTTKDGRHANKKKST